MLEQKKRTFAHAIVQWCNGSTTGFGSVCGGSNPPWTTLNPNRSLQHRFFNFILATCSPAARSRLPASCPSFFLDVARYACKKTTANLLGQPTTISSGSNDRFGLKAVQESLPTRLFFFTTFSSLVIFPTLISDKSV